MFGVHAQELVLPGFYFAAERLFEAQALVLPLLGLLAQLVDQLGLVSILRRAHTRTGEDRFRCIGCHNSMNEYFTTTDALSACDECEQSLMPAEG